MNGKIKFFTLLAVSFFAMPATKGCAYTLSTGAVVDSKNLSAPKNKGNGAAAEKWCAEAGKRLPTLEELREMYKNRDKIGGFTDGSDAGGWPYWAQRATHKSCGKDFGWRIIFGNGSETYIQIDNALVRKFGEQGEEQYRPFWIKSGFGAYVRCVKDTNHSKASPKKEKENYNSNKKKTTVKKKSKKKIGRKSKNGKRR